MPKGYKLTTEDVAKRIRKLSNNEYELLSEYVNDKTKIKVRHKECGNEYYVRASHFFSGSRCKRHMNEKTPKEFINEFEKLPHSSEYELLEEYYRAHDKIKVKHSVCGNEYMVAPRELLRGERCPKCYGNTRKTTKEFEEEVADLTKGEYSFSGEYTNNRTKVKFYHTVCDSYYYATPHDFLEGNRCPYCKQSKGEALVSRILNDCIGKNNYYIQYSFDDLRSLNNSKLPFDFYIEKLNLLIEYDGIQHFKEVKYFGGKKKLDSQKRRDNLKNKYAKDNNISIIRIPYTLSEVEVSRIINNAIKSRKAQIPNKE